MYFQKVQITFFSVFYKPVKNNSSETPFNGSAGQTDN